MAKTDRRGEPIWPFVIPAVVIASAWGGLAVLGGQERLRDEGQTTAYMAGYFFATATMASVIVWIVFYLLFYRARASFGKALGALALIVAFTFALQFAPTLALRAIQGDQRAASEHMQTSVAQVTALTDRLHADVGALDLSAYEHSGLTSKERVVEWAAKMRQAAALLQAYDAALAAEVENNTAELARLNITDAQRTTLLSDMQAGIGPESVLRRTNAARLRELNKSIELLDLLNDNPDAWAVENNAPAFYDAAQLARFERLRLEVVGLTAERQRLERLLALSSQASAQQDHRGQP